MIEEPTDPDERVGWLVEQGRLDEAITAVRATADVESLSDVHRLAGLLWEAGRPAEEEEALWRTAVADGHAWAHHGLAATLAEAGRADESIVEYRAAIAAGDRAAGARLAKVYAEVGHRDEAIAAYRSALGAAGVAWSGLGALFEQFGRDDEALAAYQAAVDAGEGHVRVRLARMLVALGRLDDATRIVREELAEREDITVYRNLGWLLAEQDRVAELEDEARRLKESNPLGLVHLIAGVAKSQNADESPGEMRDRMRARERAVTEQDPGSGDSSERRTE